MKGGRGVSSLSSSTDSLPSPSTPKKRGITERLGDLILSDASDPLVTFLSEFPIFVQEKREIIRDGMLSLHIKENSKEKIKESYVFLFNDLIVFAKKRILHEKRFKVITQVPLEDARVILVADSTSARPSFQICNLKAYYTLTPIQMDVAMATNVRNLWFKDVKQQVREYQKKKILAASQSLSNSSSNLKSPVGSPRGNTLSNSGGAPK